MDAMKAFDRTWISGVLFKLYELGLNGKTRIFDSMLREGSSRVLSYGHLSESFPLQQGTRQGSICAPFLYTVLLDELLKTLDNSGYGLKINDISLCAPTQADDIVLLSLSKSGLSELIDICRKYANKWRYTYNPSKCAVLIHNEDQRF